MKIAPISSILVGIAPLCTLASIVGVASESSNLRGDTNTRNHRHDPRSSLLMPQKHNDLTSSKQTSSSVLRNGHDETEGTSTRRRQTKEKEELLGDWKPCSTSEECDDGCCSNIYSDDDQYRCTPLEGGFLSEYCTSSNNNNDNNGGGEGEGAGDSWYQGNDGYWYLVDWELCTSSEDCGSGCCSNAYSNDQEFRCSPQQGGAMLCLVSTGGGETSPPDPVTPSTQYGLQADCYEDDPSRFNICLDLGSMDGSYRSWMDSAAAARDRWQSVIVGDTFPAINSQDLAGIPYATEVPSFIDDLYIAMYEVEIDGNLGLLGWGETTYTMYNAQGYLLTTAGRITLDIADIANVEDAGLMQALIEHEIGHVLGVGTLFDEHGLQSGKGHDLHYTGQYALQAWRDMGCSGNIPIEGDGGKGTAGCHWDEACLAGELMTGLITNGNYLSRITVGSLKDLGYDVNMDAADNFGLGFLDRRSCGDYCPEAASYFSTTRSSSSTASTSSSSSTLSTSGRSRSSEAKQLHTMMSIATAVLQGNRANRPLSLPEGINYVGGDSIRVFTADSDGRIRGTTITWDDVQEFLASPPSN